MSSRNYRIHKIDVEVHELRARVNKLESALIAVVETLEEVASGEETQTDTAKRAHPAEHSNKRTAVVCNAEQEQVGPDAA